MEQNKNKQPKPNRGSAPIPSELLNRGNGLYDTKNDKEKKPVQNNPAEETKADDSEPTNERDII